MPPIHHSLRDDMDHFPGQGDAQRRLVSHGSVGAAWNSLDVFSVDAAAEYLDRPFTALGVKADEQARLNVRDVILMFAMVAVLADRESREPESEEDIQDRIDRTAAEMSAEHAAIGEGTGEVKF